MIVRLLIVALLSIAPLARAGDDAVGPILDKMHAAGDGLVSLSTRLKMTDVDFDTNAEVWRFGRLNLHRGDAGDAIHVLFTRRAEPDGPAAEEKLEYLLSDGLLVDRNYRSQTEVRRQLPEDEQDRDLLALGEGPFPLPIGQEPERVRRLFEVSIVDVQNDNEFEVEPVDGTTRIRLVPKDETRLKEQFQVIEVDVDDAGMARQVTTFDAAGVNLRIVELREPVVNDPDADMPALEPVDLGDWNVTVEEL